MKKCSLFVVLAIFGIAIISTGCQKKNNAADVKPVTEHNKHDGHDHSSHSTDDGHDHSNHSKDDGHGH